ncbi:hypothetical protein [Aggregatibacter kilianii]|uniref:hypothetical protein n=1 Tax=Aggregatibacter kilianii TaxID=2025884 RepID=UPI001EF7E940|nr:hypothetical protein [Aggregatibacter kilianii]
MMKKYINRLTLLLFLLTACVSFTKAETPKANFQHSQIYGVTVDDSWEGRVETAQIVEALKAMAVKPTVRIVMSRNIAPKDYKELFQEIHEAAYIMATPVDSYEMKKYSKATYLKRFQDAYAALAPYVDIWEVGNEVNGDWLGKNAQVGNKVYEAYKFIKSKRAETALTTYYFAPNNQQISMEEWLNKYIPQEMKNGLNYVLVSYYEDDNDGYQPKWQAVFDDLAKIFPNSGLGIGECGNTDENATTDSKVKMASRYYAMPKYVKNYVGGYFWWYWVQDAVPHEGNKVWQAINNTIKNQNSR